MTFCNDENRYSRVTVFSPESTPFGVQEIMMQNRKRSLNIVIPLSSERLDSFQSFLRRFQEDIIAAKHHPYEISLTMIYFGKSKDSIKVMLQSFVLKTKYKNVHIEYVTDRNFSRGYALDLGVRSWTGSGDPVLFFCDVDIVFGLNFLRRCMAYSDRELSAYFPIVFSLYNPGVSELEIKHKWVICLPMLPTLYKLPISVSLGYRELLWSDISKLEISIKNFFRPRILAILWLWHGLHVQVTKVSIFLLCSSAM